MRRLNLGITSVATKSPHFQEERDSTIKAVLLQSPDNYSHATAEQMTTFFIRYLRTIRVDNKSIYRENNPKGWLPRPEDSSSHQVLIS